MVILSWLPGYTAMSYSSAFRWCGRMDYDWDFVLREDASEDTIVAIAR